MITVDEHRARILDAARPTPTAMSELADALGCILAADVFSRWPIPLFDNSGMDGYAVRRSDATAGTSLRVVADVAAGSADDPAIGPGEAVRIMTGAPVPADADAIVPLELTDLGTVVRESAPEKVTIIRQPAPGAHIRRRGEDAPAGALAVGKGTPLGPWQLSSIASAGYGRALVHRAPRVAIISTGSELIAPSDTPQRGQIPESNSVLLAAAVRASGATIISVRTIADDPATLRRALSEVDADAVIFSGGASVGAFDVVRTVLGGELGVRFDSVAMQPGRPQGFGVLESGMLAFCLPGNPVSVAASFEMFVRPTLRRMAGAVVLDRPRVTRMAATGWNSPSGRVQILPAIFDEKTVQPASRGGSGSHLVTSLAAAMAFAVVPEDVERVSIGDPVSVMVLS
ncbi:molybdopterin biosynthesis protein [Microbacterium sp. CH12i]|uniref:molybdopterin molybdotransferase MoeA n=1 Tax=Microbacterium sp. CH12i TaxID=1479651 RepID=UPI0004618807|nr:gephyrin-like molybdotransferase Glp [Microbacterium sp. CH12i]KDA06854.1 molybdopterin biosynthesis protein [Microbacterium sp. CH12i]